jgi:riboflavin biosynthesis pyrimidine reductase
MKTKRPYVICHMVTTIDGKILGNRWGKIPGQKDGANLFETTAASLNIGAWLVGTTTMKEFMGRNVRLPRAKEKIPRRDHVARPDAKTLAIGADRHGVLRFQESETHGDHVVLLVTEQASDDYLAHLRKAGVSYLFCGKRDLDLERALEKLAAAFGLTKLQLHGGGTFNGAMLRAGLIDEISHITVPVADGGGAGVTSLFDIPTKTTTPPPMAAATLKLISRKSLPGGATWARYRVVGRPNA